MNGFVQNWRMQQQCNMTILRGKMKTMRFGGIMHSIINYMIYSPSAGEESESMRSRVPQILIFKYRQIYTTTGRGSLKFLRHS